MTLDRAFVERNRAASNRVRTLVNRLSDQQLQQPVGEHWTVAIALAHLAFWDRRVLLGLDTIEREGKLTIPVIDISVNDLSLPLWAAIPPRVAANIAVESAAALDERLENFPPALLDELYRYNQRWVERALHRTAHLDEIDGALKGEPIPKPSLNDFLGTWQLAPERSVYSAGRPPKRATYQIRGDQNELTFTIDWLDQSDKPFHVVYPCMPDGKRYKTTISPTVDEMQTALDGNNLKTLSYKSGEIISIADRKLSTDGNELAVLQRYFQPDKSELTILQYYVKI